MRLRTNALGLFSVLAVLIVGGSASAVPLFDTSPVFTGGGVNVRAGTAADDFSFGFDAILESAIFSIGDPLATPWNGSTVEWFLYTDASGDPGSVVASGLGANVASTPFGASALRTFRTVSFDFSPGVALDGGVTYWLGLHLAPTFPPLAGVDLVWFQGLGPFGSASAVSIGSSTGPWSHGAGNLHFELFGAAIPEPSAVGLLTVGLWVSTRSRRSTS